jgi:hypothetical protein
MIKTNGRNWSVTHQLEYRQLTDLQDLLKSVLSVDWLIPQPAQGSPRLKPPPKKIRSQIHTKIPKSLTFNPPKNGKNKDKNNGPAANRTPDRLYITDLSRRLDAKEELYH